MDSWFVDGLLVVQSRSILPLSLSCPGQPPSTYEEPAELYVVMSMPSGLEVALKISSRHVEVEMVLDDTQMVGLWSSECWMTRSRWCRGGKKSIGSTSSSFKTERPCQGDRNLPPHPLPSRSPYSTDQPYRVDY